ncbi:asparagine synthase-domain-containing protein [Geopyxis carbonaria]|nr:asparagine synthase-domain-containing protein [Geopyxis carbonaria]
MCGIIFTYSIKPDASPSLNHIGQVSRRGPDATHQHAITVLSKTLTFTSSLLSVRGTTPTHQPVIDHSTSSLLCWNGNAWRIHGQDLLAGINDTQEVFKLLNDGTHEVNDLMGKLDGEYAFVFYDAPRQKVWYGRDWAGRRSLVKRVNEDGAVHIASVGDGEAGWVEVDAGGLWCLDIDSGTEQWVTKTSDGQLIWNIPSLNMTIEDSELTDTSIEVKNFHETLKAAIKLRVQEIPPLPVAPQADDARLAVLFSGGVDCTILARLAHEVLPLNEPIDLLNVAFENPRIVAARQNEQKAAKKKNESTQQKSDVVSDAVDIDPYSLCPDRATGLSSYEELVTACPGRPFRFVAINIPYSEVLAHRPTVISLMSPHNTEMDLSIALAFYFAARGSGVVHNTTVDYKTPARILLSGLGADELLGGYTRHATAFSRSGYSGLLAELQLDFDRLGKRNLGRDDRVVSTWARETRYPFLDEKVVAWAMSVPVTSKCPFAKQEMGKTVLRLLAKTLGMRRASQEAKRAVQFGARSAKMSSNDRRMKGTDSLS